MQSHWVSSTVQLYRVRPTQIVAFPIIKMVKFVTIADKYIAKIKSLKNRAVYPGNIGTVRRPEFQIKYVIDGS